MYVPKGYELQYRYRHRGPRINVQPGLQEKLASSQDLNVYIVFLDRGPIYRFFPLRRAKLITTFESGDYLNISVAGLEFCASNDPIAFTALVREWEGTPENPGDFKDQFDDGHYALLAPEIDSAALPMKDDQAWATNVDRLSKAPAMASGNDMVAFLRCDLDKSLKIKHSKITNSNAIHLGRGQSTDLKMTCLIPEYRNTQKDWSGSVRVAAQIGLALVPPMSIYLDGPSNQFTGRLRVSKFAPNKTDALILTDAHAIDGSGNAKEICLPNAALVVVIPTQTRRVLALGAAVCLYLFGSYLKAAGGFQIPFPWQLTLTFDQIESLGKGIGEAISALAVFYFFYELNQKPV